jgi:hypothetical protein
MTPPKLIVAALLGLFSCGQSSNNTRVFSETTSVNDTTPKITSTSKPMQADKELWTLYSKSDTIYHVKRLVSVESNYSLLTYDVNASQPEEAHQTFINKQTVNASELDKTKTDNASFNWTPFKATPVLFVQLQYAPFKDQMAALDKRQQIEQLIDKELKSQALGQWIAGDIGPGEANMLFEVQDIARAKTIVLSILAKEGLDKATLIGRRVNTSADDWFYEVIYPIDFNAAFLTM